MDLEAQGSKVCPSLCQKAQSRNKNNHNKRYDYEVHEKYNEFRCHHIDGAVWYYYDGMFP